MTIPPGPKSRLPGASLLAMRRDTLGFLRSLALTYGDLVHFQVGKQDYFLVNDPDVIRDILVTDHRNFLKGRGLEVAKRLLGEGLLTSEGEFHRRQRRLAQPAFHRQRIAAYGAVMTERAERLSAEWQDGARLDIAQEMMRLTLGIVAKTLFDTDLEAETQEIGQAVSEAVHQMDFAMLPFFALIERLNPAIKRRFERTRARLDATMYRMIREHRADTEDRGDLLSMLLLAQDELGDGAGMTDEQLRDEAMTIFLAGHETTANALTWTWYLLSQHPEAELKLHAELDSVLAGRLPTDADVASLPYTRRILSESMRCYPPAWVIGRRVIADYRIGEYTLPAGSICMLSQYVTHHDPRWYPDPMRFDPDRWTPEAQEQRPKFAYYPFGSGPRVCIGEGFAWMEGILLIATLAQRWQLRLVADQKIAMQPVVTLRPRYGMQMILERRDTPIIPIINDRPFATANP
ncbi:MAG: Cytochrome [Chthonomonadaceae bacterium]|nr:Cytochrome [Chthonomonadaceae bacterium]